MIGSCVKQMPLAGRDITKFFLNMMRERGEVFPLEEQMTMAKDIKEKYGYICQSPLIDEFSKYDKDLEEISKSSDFSSKFIKRHKITKPISNEVSNGIWKIICV